MKIDRLIANQYRKPTIQTPWGPSQQQEERARGIVFHSTASHGGYLLEDDRQRTVATRFPAFRTFCGVPNAYEEDCDWAVVAIVFQDAFDENQIYGAVRTVRAMTERGMAGVDRRPGWQQVSDYLASPQGRIVMTRFNRYAAGIAGKWEVCSESSAAPSGWDVRLRKVNGSECRTVRFPKLAEKQFYSAEELDAIEKDGNGN